MKKKIVAMMMVLALGASTLVACGGSDDTATETKTEAEAPAADEAADDAAADGMVSDETFANLQDTFAILVDEYNQVKEMYEADEVAADANIEDVLNDCADLINEMGEITQEELTEADADVLIDSMVKIEDTLNLVINGMTVVESDGLATDAEIAELQDNFAALKESYDIVSNLYYETEEIPADAEIEAHLENASELIAEIGDIETANLTSQDCSDINDAMVSILEYLEAIVDAM